MSLFLRIKKLGPIIGIIAAILLVIVTLITVGIAFGILYFYFRMKDKKVDAGMPAADDSSPLAPDLSLDQQIITSYSRFIQIPKLDVHFPVTSSEPIETILPVVMEGDGTYHEVLPIYIFRGKLSDGYGQIYYKNGFKCFTFLVDGETCYMLDGSGTYTFPTGQIILPDWGYMNIFIYDGKKDCVATYRYNRTLITNEFGVSKNADRDFLKEFIVKRLLFIGQSGTQSVSDPRFTVVDDVSKEELAKREVAKKIIDANGLSGETDKSVVTEKLKDVVGENEIKIVVDHLDAPSPPPIPDPEYDAFVAEYEAQLLSQETFKRHARDAEVTVITAIENKLLLEGMKQSKVNDLRGEIRTRVRRYLNGDRSFRPVNIARDLLSK